MTPPITTNHHTENEVIDTADTTNKQPQLGLQEWLRELERQERKARLKPKPQP